MPKFLNLACGPVFIDSREWTNVDFNTKHSSVLACNLLKGLPFADNSFDAVYSSHFIEHIPIEQVDSFLRECLRVLKPKGIVRIVTPDFEEMCSAYLSHRKHGSHEKADFISIEILDQLVRRQPCGRLGTLMDFYRSKAQYENDMIRFIEERTGDSLETKETGGEAYSLAESPSATQRTLDRAKAIKTSLPLIIKNKWHSFLLSQMPSAFRDQNVSYTSIGEKHHWLWDYHQLSLLLLKCGFSNPAKLTHETTSIPLFPLYSLDQKSNGKPRKGLESMYIEAEHP